MTALRVLVHRIRMDTVAWWDSSIAFVALTALCALLVAGPTGVLGTPPPAPTVAPTAAVAGVRGTLTLYAGPGRTPDYWLIDNAAPGKPVVVLTTDEHAALQALAAYNPTEETS